MASLAKVIDRSHSAEILVSIEQQYLEFGSCINAPAVSPPSRDPITTASNWRDIRGPDNQNSLS